MNRKVITTWVMAFEKKRKSPKSTEPKKRRFTGEKIERGNIFNLSKVALARYL